jgi:carbonic anhydrase/acetyltransferase-like protein (isoleucine patch superfamily)
VQIGRQCWLSNHNMSLVTPDLVSFGDAVSMGSDCHFYNATPTAAGRITFSDGVDVGHQATLFPGCVLKPGCVLGAKSNVMEAEVLPAGAIRLVSVGYMQQCTAAAVYCRSSVLPQQCTAPLCRAVVTVGVEPIILPTHLTFSK